MSHRDIRQRGSIAIMAAAGLSLAVILLASIDIGYLFYAQRDLQKVVDMAALAGATQLNAPCTSQPADEPVVVAARNAKLNLGLAQDADFPGTLVITCGHWTRTPNSFTPYEAGQEKQNAVQVEARRDVAPLLGLLPQTVRATATATRGGEPIAAFSVGAKLLQVNGGVVPQLLARLGLDPSGTSLASYEGLANLTISSGALLQALGFPVKLDADIATVKEVLSLGAPGCTANACPLGRIIDAIGTVGGQRHFVNTLGIQLDSLALATRLVTDDNGRGILTLLESANGEAALGLELNALDLLTAALAVANNGRAVDLPLHLGALGTVNARAGIVEPPSIAIGGVGTTAYTAQVRLFLELTTAHTPLVGNVTANALKSQVRLPITIDLTDSKGTLTELCVNRNADNKPLATVQVESSVLKTCIGRHAGGVFDRTASCSDGLQDEQLVSLLDGLLRIDTHFALDGLADGGSVELAAGQSGSVGSNLDLGQNLPNRLKAITATLTGKLLDSGSGDTTVTSITPAALADRLLQAVPGSAAALAFVNGATGSLTAFTDTLGPAVTSLLSSTLQGNVVGLLSAIGRAAQSLASGIGSLLAGIGGLLSGPCSINPLQHHAQQCVAQQLAGNVDAGGISVSQVALTLSGMVVQLLQPTLAALGDLLSGLITTLLGDNLGVTDVGMLDIDCSGGGVKLVQ